MRHRVFKQFCIEVLQQGGAKGPRTLASDHPPGAREESGQRVQEGL
jgi:hypothetical protein